MNPSLDWRHRAACLDEDPERFFPIGTTGPALERVEEAKAVCRRCEVASDCLAYALQTHQDYGVWGGGLSEDERRALRRSRPRRHRNCSQWNLASPGGCCPTLSDARSG